MENIMDKIESNKEIQQEIKKIQELFSKGKRVSDIIAVENGREYQYVDIVMEGGGVLGVALVGYIYALERAGIRFLSIGGTSVGAVVSLFLAAAGYRNEEKGEKLAKVLFDLDFKEFIDGNRYQRAISLELGKDDQSRFKILISLLPHLRYLWRGVGLNRGTNFKKWVEKCLEGFGVKTYQDLEDRIQKLPDQLMYRNKKERIQTKSGFRCDLTIVTADIITETKVLFPKMAPLYWEDPQSINPSNFIRASMSIPLFFDAMEVNNVDKISEASKKWKELAGYEGTLPNKAVFVDGGIISNFPIDVFHEDGVPTAPTLGVKLGAKTRMVNNYKNVISFTGAMFDSMRHYADFDFIAKHPDYNKLIAFIDTKGFNWLNFFLTEEDKIQLFARGVKAAHEFLRGFDWEGYKNVRRTITRA